MDSPLEVDRFGKRSWQWLINTLNPTTGVSALLRPGEIQA